MLDDSCTSGCHRLNNHETAPMPQTVPVPFPNTTSTTKSSHGRSSRLSRLVGLFAVGALAIPATAFSYTLQKVADMATGHFASYTAINNHGEVVWIDNGGAVTSWEVYSSVHGRITNDGFSDALPVINDSGQIAWQSGRAPVGNPSDWEVMLDGVRLTNNTGFDGEVNITNAGEVIWTGVGGIQSSTRGVLVASGGSSLDVNELGEVVYRNGSNQIVSTTRGVIGGPGDHPSINDSGEVVWITLTQQVMSSTRGLIATSALMPAINNAGLIVYSKFDGTNFNIYAYENGVETAVTTGRSIGLDYSLNNLGQIAFTQYDPFTGISSVWVATPDVRGVPEPGTLALGALIACGVVAVRRRA